MRMTIPFLAVFTLLAVRSGAQTITDIDGNVYDTIHIGTQIWTKPNLKVTHYRNGDPIPNVTDSAQWYGLTSGAYCDYDNDPNNAVDYGHLYNWYAVQDPRNIAPLGWHVPTYEDWDALQVYLGYDLVAGGKLKEMGTAHWMFPNTGASDEYDFTALPGGQRADSIYSGTFTEITQQGYWWSSSEMDTVYPWGVNISYNSEGMTNWAASTRKSGFSIRLVNDVPLDIGKTNTEDYFTFYPNPATDRVVISNASVANMNLEIDNLVGTRMMQQQLSGSENTIDISALSPGVYIIKLFTGDWSVQKKLIKE